MFSSLTRARRRAAAAAALLLLGGAVAAATIVGTAPTPVRAQDGAASPPRPSHIHSGDCDELGPIVQPLANLNAPGTDVIGNDEAVVAEAAFTNIPLTLEEMTASDHAVKVHLSREQIDVYLACGDIGGTLAEDGALIVGLKELDGSGYTGIAYLRPLPNGTTDTSVIIAEVIPRLVGPAAEEDAAAAPAAGVDAAAAGEATTVAVSLTEFAIEMPTEVAAGPVRFEISNDGAAPHNFVVEGNGVDGRLPGRLAPGTSATLEVDLPAGTYTVFCPVGEGVHRANGMELTLTVR
jgi:plastocyanin